MSGPVAVVKARQILAALVGIVQGYIFILWRADLVYDLEPEPLAVPSNCRSGVGQGGVFGTEEELLCRLYAMGCLS